MNLQLDTDELDAALSTVRYLTRENMALRTTLRDDFAKAALIGLVGSHNPTIEEAATAAYAIADAMMEARK